MENDEDNQPVVYANQTPPRMKTAAKKVYQELLPKASEKTYKKAYEKFKKWCLSERTTHVSEDILLIYFTEYLKPKYCPNTLWQQYSCLKATIALNEKGNIDISEYPRLLAFLKRNSENYEPKKAKVLTNEQLKEFLDLAPNNKYLCVKVATIFAIQGCLRIDELTAIQIENMDIIPSKQHIYVKILTTKNKQPASFLVNPVYYAIVMQYLSLRPPAIKHKGRLFIKYDVETEKCTSQVIGKNKLAKMPRIIAEYLNLPEPDSYTGHAYRRTSATLLANAGGSMREIKTLGHWKSTVVADTYAKESQIDKLKVSNLIMSNIHGNSNATVSTAAVESTSPYCPVNAKSSNSKIVYNKQPINSNATVSTAAVESTSPYCPVNATSSNSKIVYNKQPIKPSRFCIKKPLKQFRSQEIQQSSQSKTVRSISKPVASSIQQAMTSAISNTRSIINDNSNRCKQTPSLSRFRFKKPKMTHRSQECSQTSQSQTLRSITSISTPVATDSDPFINDNSNIHKQTTEQTTVSIHFDVPVCESFEESNADSINDYTMTNVNDRDLSYENIDDYIIEEFVSPTFDFTSANSTSINSTSINSTSINTTSVNCDPIISNPMNLNPINSNPVTHTYTFNNCNVTLHCGQ